MSSILPYSLEVLDAVMKACFDGIEEYVDAPMYRTKVQCPVAPDREFVFTLDTKRFSVVAPEVMYNISEVITIPSVNSTTNPMSTKEKLHFAVYAQLYTRDNVPCTRTQVGTKGTNLHAIEISQSDYSKAYFETEDTLASLEHTECMSLENLTEEKYFQLSTLHDIPLSLEELVYITGANSVPKGYSAYVRTPYKSSWLNDYDDDDLDEHLSIDTEIIMKMMIGEIEKVKNNVDVLLKVQPDDSISVFDY